MNFAARNEHVVPLFVKSHILPYLLHFQSICCLMYDVQNKIAPHNILELFTNMKYIHRYGNYSLNFYITKSRLEAQQKAFSRVGALVWNDLPVS